MRWLCAVGAKYFFKSIEVIGKENIPDDSGYILAVNHQNSFIDAIICAVTNPPSLHYLTRSDVFVPPWDTILGALHMMPVYRMRDGIAKLSKNEETFARCYRLMEDHGGVLIFSEANTIKHHYLRPLSKGTARLAIQSQQAVSQPMYIVPTGLNYVHHDESNHKVVVQYGKPIAVNDYMQAYQEEPPQTLNKLKKDLTDAIKSLMWIPEKDDHYEKKSAIVRHFGDYCSFQELTALINDHERVSLPENRHKSRILKSLMSLPNWPVFYLTGVILKQMQDPQFILSIKFLASIFLLPIYWLLIYILILPFLGFWITNVVIALMILSLFLRAQVK